MMSERLSQLRRWLEQQTGAPPQSCVLSPIYSDASFRRYFRIQINGISRVVADSPPQHENNRAFLEMATRLRDCSLNVPQVLAADLERGFLLLTDLGTELYLQAVRAREAGALYDDAIEALLRIQQCTAVNGLPEYDQALLLEEMQLFPTWLAEHLLELRLSRSERQMLRHSFGKLCDAARAQPQVLVHRDYHSRNLLYIPGAGGNPGILDFQDAVIGPYTYDPVSLLKDCYVRWPPEQVRHWALSYFEQARQRGIIPALDPVDFLRSFTLMGVQRHLKASGIFARLYLRDGKSAYLPELPRTLAYITELGECCPELKGLPAWIQSRVLPRLERVLRSSAPVKPD